MISAELANHAPSILLDTNVLLWILGNDPRLSKRVQTAVLSPSADIRVSVVSALEIVLKFQAGKLSLDVPIERVLSEVFNCLRSTTILSTGC